LLIGIAELLAAREMPVPWQLTPLNATFIAAGVVVLDSIRVLFDNGKRSCDYAATDKHFCTQLQDLRSGSKVIIRSGTSSSFCVSFLRSASAKTKHRAAACEKAFASGIA
jgi:hypothetical protein